MATTQTHTLMADAAAEEHNTQDGTGACIQFVFQDDKNVTSKIPLLDSVLSGFLTTNQHRGKQHSFEDLLTNRTYHERFFRYDHASLSYLAEVVTVAGMDFDWVHLKLDNGGFEDHTHKDGAVISRPKAASSTGWLTLPPTKAMEWLPSLVAASKPHFKCVRVYYNYVEQRLDIKLYPKEGHTAMLVTLEYGYPDMEDAAELGELP